MHTHTFYKELVTDGRLILQVLREVGLWMHLPNDCVSAGWESRGHEGVPTWASDSRPRLWWLFMETGTQKRNTLYSQWVILEYRDMVTLVHIHNYLRVWQENTSYIKGWLFCRTIMSCFARTIHSDDWEAVLCCYVTRVILEHWCWPDRTHHSGFLFVFKLQVSHTFSEYGPGMRFISFEHGGQDTRYWDGWFGVRVTGSAVTVEVWSRRERMKGERSWGVRTTERWQRTVEKVSGLTEWSFEVSRGPALPYAVAPVRKLTTLSWQHVSFTNLKIINLLLATVNSNHFLLPLHSDLPWC